MSRIDFACYREPATSVFVCACVRDVSGGLLFSADSSGARTAVIATGFAYD